MIKKILWQDCVMSMNLRKLISDTHLKKTWKTEVISSVQKFSKTTKVVPLLERVQTVHVEDVTLKMGLVVAEVPCLALTVEEPSYQKYWCGPSALDKLLMGHGEEEALAKTLLMHLVEGEALLRAAQL